MDEPATVEFHPEAIEEASSARAWYAERSPAAALAFVGELDQAVEQVTRSPKTWPPFDAGTQRFLFRRFPFALVYRVRGTTIQVVAVAHCKRRPGYWKSR